MNFHLEVPVLYFSYSYSEDLVKFRLAGKVVIAAATKVAVPAHLLAIGTVVDATVGLTLLEEAKIIFWAWGSGRGSHDHGGERGEDDHRKLHRD